jgi:hypothetical protein
VSRGRLHTDLAVVAVLILMALAHPLDFIADLMGLP